MSEQPEGDEAVSETHWPAPTRVSPQGRQQPFRPRRMSREFKQVIVAVAVSISVLIAIFAVKPTPPVGHGGCGGDIPIILGTSMQSNMDNWTLLISYAACPFLLSKTTMTIYDDNGTIIQPMHDVALSMLTAHNWTTYKVQYWQRDSSKTEVQPGDEIRVSKAVYTEGCAWEIETEVNGSRGIVSMGHFG